MKIRQIIVLILGLVSITLSGCKTDNWLDWKAQNQLWLEHNKTQANVRSTSSGLQYRIIADPGAKWGEARPDVGKTVVCDYTGRLVNGVVFEQSKNAALDMSVLTAGFAEGLKQIHTHGDIELYIPYNLAYGKEGSGTEGAPSYIPPYSTLIFTVHLSAIQ